MHEGYVASLALIINDIIVGFEEENTIEVVVEIYLQDNKTIATAESCTGEEV
jgi:nicotinamide-nucleotide amidase